MCINKIVLNNWILITYKIECLTGVNDGSDSGDNQGCRATDKLNFMQSTYVKILRITVEGRNTINVNGQNLLLKTNGQIGLKII